VRSNIFRAGRKRLVRASWERPANREDEIAGHGALMPERDRHVAIFPAELGAEGHEHAA
jgi:hypothetical protein